MFYIELKRERVQKRTKDQNDSGRKITVLYKENNRTWLKTDLPCPFFCALSIQLNSTLIRRVIFNWCYCCFPCLQLQLDKLANWYGIGLFAQMVLHERICNGFLQLVCYMQCCFLMSLCQLNGYEVSSLSVGLRINFSSLLMCFSSFRFFGSFLTLL